MVRGEGRDASTKLWVNEVAGPLRSHGACVSALGTCTQWHRGLAGCTVGVMTSGMFSNVLKIRFGA